MKEEFYIVKERRTFMYLEDNRIEITGHLEGVLDPRNLIKTVTVKLNTFSVQLARSNFCDNNDDGISFKAGEIINQGKKLGYLIIFKDLKTKKILTELLKGRPIVDMDTTEDTNRDMINLLVKIKKL